MPERSYQDIHREQLEILLNHAHEMKPELRTAFENSGFYLGNGSYIVLLFTMTDAFSCNEPDFQDKWDRLHNALRDTVSNTLQTKFLNHTEVIGETVCSLLCLPDKQKSSVGPGVTERILSLATHIRSFFADSVGAEVCVAVSATYSGLAGINAAYRDAMDIMRYARFLASAPPILIQQLQGAEQWQQEETVIMRRWLDRIMDGIRDSNEQLIYKNAEELVSFITEVPPYGQYYFNLRIQIFIYHFRNALFEADMAHFDFLDQINPAIGLTLAPDELSFRRMLYDYLYHVWNNYRDTTHGGSMDEASRIRRYLDSHISDVALSVSSAAERLGITESSMTYQLKKHLGYTPTEYISRCRAAMARRMVSETRLPIERIAGSVGFGSYLTMHRAFKKYYGAAPGAFRSKEQCAQSTATHLPERTV